MDLGAFSISLAVKDLQKSKAFYEAFGFEKFGGDEAHHYLMMRNGTTVIGLFQGMFDKNVLTFNPGWAADGKHPATFTDVRELQKQLRAKGIEFVTEADESTTGIGSFTLLDPDGNPVLVDQHRAE